MLKIKIKILPEQDKLPKIKFNNLFVSGVWLHDTEVEAGIFFLNSVLNWTEWKNVKITNYFCIYTLW